MTEIKETGGARIGMANATWPFVTLTVNKDKLELNATLLGKFVFKPTDIVSIEPYKYMFSSGVKINHTVNSYNAKIIYWNRGNTTDLINRIQQTGFLSNTNPVSPLVETEIMQAQARGGFPIKTSAAIAIVVIWNVLCFAGFPVFSGGKPLSSSIIVWQLPLGFILLTCLLLLVSEPFRQLVLKEGKNINDFKLAVYFVMAIEGFMLIISIVAMVSMKNS